MTIKEASYAIAPRGVATAFTESELPVEYARKMRNRFINAAGGAEKRRGIQQLGDTISSSPTITGLHELVKADSTEILFASGGGKIYKYDGSSAYSQVYAFNSTEPVRSVQMGLKLILYNGVDKDVWTEDGTTFEELRPLIEVGEATTGTNNTGLHDSDITNWITQTNVSINDLVWNRTSNAFGIITAVATASVAHTQIAGTAATPGIGRGSANQISGHRYEIWDLVELNVIPTDGDDDNVATVGAGTSATGIRVSAVSNWHDTEVRVGDYIRNTTRTAVTQVTAVTTAHLRVHGITGQTTGDSIVLMKSAMPITKFAHVHFGRLYHIDARDNKKVRISGADNPQDMTTDAGTLDSFTFSFGTQQPQGDAAVTMGSFQRFFYVGGKQNSYMYEGTTPVAYASGDTIDFKIIGLFPQGVVSPDGAVSTGNDLVFASDDGMQSVSLVQDASTLGRANLSEQIKTTLRDLFASLSETDIKLIHYPRRSWILVKAGSEMYCFNYTPYFNKDQLGASARGRTPAPEAGSWSLFDGAFARQNAYLVRRNGDLIAGGAGGKVYKCDVDGVYTDDGEIYRTEYQTGWLTLDEPKKQVHLKAGKYIRPLFATGSNITYEIRSDGSFAADANDVITITASGGSQAIGNAIIGDTTIGGSSTQDPKWPLRWRGKEVRITISTEDDKGPDTISRFTIYANLLGKE